MHYLWWCMFFLFLREYLIFTALHHIHTGCLHPTKSCTCHFQDNFLSLLILRNYPLIQTYHIIRNILAKLSCFLFFPFAIFLLKWQFYLYYDKVIAYHCCLLLLYNKKCLWNVILVKADVTSLSGGWRDFGAYVLAAVISANNSVPFDAGGCWRLVLTARFTITYAHPKRHRYPPGNAMKYLAVPSGKCRHGPR